MKSGSPVMNGARPNLRRQRGGFPDELELIRRRIEVLEHRLLRLGGSPLTGTVYQDRDRRRRAR
jgi:hypothetical protein